MRRLSDLPIISFKMLMMREPDPKWLVFAYGVWINIFLFLLMVILMRFSVFGRRVYALGANEEAARYSGINGDTKSHSYFYSWRGNVWIGWSDVLCGNR